MGINASYTQIQNKRNIDSDIIANAFIEIFRKEFRFIEKKNLTFQEWKTDKNLFCIAITPITCFDLSGWDNDADKNWTLINFSHYNKKITL